MTHDAFGEKLAGCHGGQVSRGQGASVSWRMVTTLFLGFAWDRSPVGCPACGDREPRLRHILQRQMSELRLLQYHDLLHLDSRAIRLQFRIPSQVIYSARVKIVSRYCTTNTCYQAKAFVSQIKCLRSHQLPTLLPFLRISLVPDTLDETCLITSFVSPNPMTGRLMLLSRGQGLALRCTSLPLLYRTITFRLPL